MGYRIIDLGTQQGQWKGKTTERHKIMLSFELPDERMRDDRPFSVHQRFTFSASKKSSMRKFLESWRGVPFSDDDFGKFDLGALLAKPCMLGSVEFLFHCGSDKGAGARKPTLSRFLLDLGIQSIGQPDYPEPLRFWMTWKRSGLPS